MSSGTNEALKIWKALQPMVQQEIKAQTRSCVRAKKMVVTEAPANNVMGVQEPFGPTIHVPYSSSLASVQAGDAVWVWWFYGNASTMIAMTRGDGQLA